MKRFSLCSARERITASILCAVLTVCMGILICILRFDLLSLLICAVACIAVGAGLVFYVLNLYRCGITVQKGASTLLVHGFPEYTVDLKEAVSLQTAAFKNGPVATRTLVFSDEAGNIVASIPTFFTANQGAYAEPMARELAESLGIEPNAQEATLLYIALATDCGSFQYHNTKADTLLAASKLVRLGADNATVNTVFFRKVSMARIKLESMIYSGMSFYREGKIAVAVISQQMLRDSGATEDDMDDLAGLAGRSEGSLLNITIREQKDGSSKVSVRSTKDVSSSDICAVFGGGGHAMAAGCTIDCEPEKARDMLLAVVEEVWK